MITAGTNYLPCSGLQITEEDQRRLRTLIKLVLTEWALYGQRREADAEKWSWLIRQNATVTFSLQIDPKFTVCVVRRCSVQTPGLFVTGLFQSRLDLHCRD